MRFGLVGLSGVAVNFAVFRAVLALAPTWPTVANAVAVEVSILTNYLANARFTFGRGYDWGSLGRYNLAALGGFLAQVAVFWVLVRQGWPKDGADLAAIPCGTLLTFAASWGWVFRPKQGRETGGGGSLGGAGSRG
ncbi:MAG: GtrA family protein [Firmicutes bacterium]|nr:GtrA family protein [Alicyclobacillaceae bacterium]MCL6497665.1 GtrA family protein [Bacillota bacterium]